MGAYLALMSEAGGSGDEGGDMTGPRGCVNAGADRAGEARGAGANGEGQAGEGSGRRAEGASVARGANEGES